MAYTRTLSLCAACAITGAGLVIMGAPAFGQGRPVVVEAPPADVITKRVSFADLNLASATGEKALYRRVGYAVSSVCRDANPNAVMYIRQACQSDSWAGARPQMDRAIERARQMASLGQPVSAAAIITITVAK